jgi:hypothetical protein
MGPSDFNYTGVLACDSASYGLCFFFPPDDGGGGGPPEELLAVQPVNRIIVEVELFVLAS